MSQFDEDIALTRVSDSHYSLVIQDTWSVMVGPNGGYIGAILLNGMLEELGDKNKQVRSITFHYLSPSKPGPASLEVILEKQGRSLSTLTARLVQNDRIVAISLATFAPARENFAFRHFDMPQVVGPEEIEVDHRMNKALLGHVPFRDHYDQRLAIGPVPPLTSDKARVGGWTRFKSPRTFDCLAIVAISDSWFPGLFVKDLPEKVHAPTIDHSVHFFSSLPSPGLKEDDFVLVEFTTEVVQEGYLQEDGRIWSPSGELIAQSRQLAVVMSDD